MYFVRILLGHLWEGLHIIRAIKNSPYLMEVVETCPDVIRRHFDACIKVIGTKDYLIMRKMRNDVSFHYQPQPVEDALSDDLNTPLAISAIQQLDDPASLRAAGQALGLLQQDAEAWFRWAPAGSSGPGDAEIEAAIASRQAARKAKNFKEADRIRDDLKANGVILEDGPTGTTWKRG